MCTACGAVGFDKMEPRDLVVKWYGSERWCTRIAMRAGHPVGQGRVGPIKSSLQPFRLQHIIRDRPGPGTGSRIEKYSLTEIVGTSSVRKARGCSYWRCDGTARATRPGNALNRRAGVTAPILAPMLCVGAHLGRPPVHRHGRSRGASGVAVTKHSPKQYGSTTMLWPMQRVLLMPYERRR